MLPVRGRIASQTMSGWRLQTNWSKTFTPTGTHVALAGYRYSTEGYRDYGDVLGERSVSGSNTQWRSDTLRQNQFTVTVNQTLSSYGNLWLSGSMMDYYSDRGSSTQLQAGYNTTFGRMTLGMSFSRQDTGGVTATVHKCKRKHGNAYRLNAFGYRRT